MKATWFNSFGSAKDVMQIGTQPKPSANHGEVLIKLSTSGVNPSDVKKRAGAFPNLLDNGLVIPHSDGAGVIESVGEGVDIDRVGERVWVYQAQYGRLLGTAAEYIALDSTRAVKLPDNTDFNVGACLGIPVMTAHRCVFSDGDIVNQTVLVTGGAGRVGYYAIQWAKIAGAKVIATASNAEDRSLCLSLGASAVVNHRESNWSKQVLEATGGEKINRVIDVEFGMNLPEVLECIATNGVIATYSSTVVKEPQLPFIRMMFMDITLRMVIVYAMPESAKLQAIHDINKALEQEKLQHRIAHILPLERIADSHQLIEKGGFGGCVIVKIDDHSA
ncbi:MAG: zinc-binding dehydrogenase [SAR86 cluster bacterium BACL1 MAG-121105-bin34]|jgi:NADPH:quinone reductase|uniref:Zinc-binding dehydrogenase n=2 Tax=SAR86 cluster TaxID=62672 RepID=A0A0R2U948_9GAMM|nr:MAG: zinc-binding dehydrogenase [SAR86 cluster bacterium BACL1 MAG-120507-bin14]KRO40993.1 MAG: zinc-binding dehydrogenase [SAR86 cluster bacterium BACL1 MAG-120920-bin57]KRO96022.1 MAG: zinc-binding dehydrogenase [SAR86 cluster bacterium BACL1 MAG-120820-bin45]KRO98462.1 MAG: zinc-binding dehydrogenase [SAR86 cluster bacterium BACL1 MAG-120823-bin87]KRP01911.1 MAG: zinc-binding dehydrogenase [SAR86 cluster bacterium BACL1 MAG-120619-bin26]KRP02401.1 MAG: zinc-binding dehydrogenase [SAR86 c